MNMPTWNGRTWQELEQWERDLMPTPEHMTDVEWESWKANPPVSEWDL